MRGRVASAKAEQVRGRDDKQEKTSARNSLFLKSSLPPITKPPPCFPSQRPRFLSSSQKKSSPTSKSFLISATPTTRRAGRVGTGAERQREHLLRLGGKKKKKRKPPIRLEIFSSSASAGRLTRKRPLNAPPLPIPQFLHDTACVSSCSPWPSSRPSRRRALVSGSFGRLGCLLEFFLAASSLCFFPRQVSW